MTALIDVNVALDVLLDRQPFVHDSAAVWQACDAGQFDGYLSAITLTIIFYVVEKTADNSRALSAIDVCLSAFEIAAVDRTILRAARAMPGKDFEDNVQAACAAGLRMDYIVTRDSTGFANSPIRALTPAEFLRKLATLSP
jgi:predicted nucleic acid-binding protein